LAMSRAIMEDKARILVDTYKQSHAVFEYERRLRVRASSSGMVPFCFPRSPCVVHISPSDIFSQLRGGVVGEPGQMAHESAFFASTWRSAGACTVGSWALSRSPASRRLTVPGALAFYMFCFVYLLI
jgi:hypothetical protein